MYDIRQFKPALYILLTMGFTGFALAAQTPGLWVLAMTLLSLNAWLLWTKRFAPLPRFVANGITLVAFLFVVLQVFRAPGTPILVIGQFLVLLQIVKVYEQRANRDYAQLLVLSLLLMVAASVSTASLVFGVLLIAYLFLSLYCCLLFHLKVETDQARTLIAIPVDQSSPDTLRQDQRYLSRSMRRLTGLVSSVSLTMAVLVFIFFPRGAGAGLFGQLQFRPAQTLTGFSDQVSFQNIARISQSQEVVANVELFKNDQRVEGTQQLLLRGVTLDVYTGNDDDVGSPWQWIRSRDSTIVRTAAANEVLNLPGTPSKGDVWRQEISLRPTGTNVLFAMTGASSIKSNRDFKLNYALADGTLATESPLLQPLQYQIISRDQQTEATILDKVNELGRALRRTDSEPRTSRIDPKISQYALRPEVSGSDAQGALAPRRPRFREPDNGVEARVPNALDDVIATNIERHLRSAFSYTLDLTDARNIVKDQDPIVAFLYDLKRGHCEYFAGAMTLLCQSLGMDARMVVGFKCDDFNNLGHYYTVRQSHAHAWVEVRTPTGWKTYDPTSSREAGAANAGGMWKKLRNLFDYMEFTWASNVVAYDRQSRENLLENMESKMSQAADSGTRTIINAKDWANLPQFWNVSTNLLSAIIGLMVLGLLGAVCWFLYERWRLRRRAARIGLDTLPATDQLRLVRQLGFYHDLIRLLDRHQISRAKHLTPLEFSDSLSHLPVDVYDSIHRLTLVFYRIRYGDARLKPNQQRRLATVITKVGAALDAASVKT